MDVYALGSMPAEAEALLEAEGAGEEPDGKNAATHIALAALHADLLRPQDSIERCRRVRSVEGLDPVLQSSAACVHASALHMRGFDAQCEHVAASAWPGRVVQCELTPLWPFGRRSLAQGCAAGGRGLYRARAPSAAGTRYEAARCLQAPPTGLRGRRGGRDRGRQARQGPPGCVAVSCTFLPPPCSCGPFPWAQASPRRAIPRRTPCPARRTGLRRPARSWSRPSSSQARCGWTNAYAARPLRHSAVQCALQWGGAVTSQARGVSDGPTSPHRATPPFARTLSLRGRVSRRRCTSWRQG